MFEEIKSPASPEPSIKSETAPKPVVIYACSGCSDAGELADRTARTLSQQKVGEMSCLAGIGGRVKPLVQKAERAERILVIDGCPLNCARHTLELAGLKEFEHLQLQNLGFRKGACPPTPERIDTAVQSAKALIEKKTDTVGANEAKHAEASPAPWTGG
jgi:uncharacterized metal-binding protein